MLVRRVALSRTFAIALLAAGGFAFAQPSDEMHSSTVLGANAMLSEGAAALMREDWKRGIELTQLGLTTVLSADDRAAALANLCAGFAALKDYKTALGYCDQSVAIIDSNWRTWQNRAAANLGLGNFEEALRDIQRGLQLNPDSDSLQKTLAIARDYEKLHRERMQHLLES
jgi:tetratricopeptide (TPR) repeat protein